MATEGHPEASGLPQERLHSHFEWVGVRIGITLGGQPGSCLFVRHHSVEQSWRKSRRATRRLEGHDVTHLDIPDGPQHDQVSGAVGWLHGARHHHGKLVGHLEPQDGRQIEEGRDQEQEQGLVLAQPADHPTDTPRSRRADRRAYHAARPIAPPSGPRVSSGAPGAQRARVTFRRRSCRCALAGGHAMCRRCPIRPGPTSPAWLPGRPRARC